MSANSTTVSYPINLTLADFTSPGLIIPQLEGQDSASVIQELSHALQHEKRVPDSLSFYHAVLNREFMVSTEMEAGVALPHARLSGVKEISFAVGKSDVPLAWGTKAIRSVWLVFSIAVPETDSTQYLLLISGLARLSKDRILMGNLRNARNTFEIMDVLKRVPLRTATSSNPVKRMVV